MNCFITFRWNSRHGVHRKLGFAASKTVSRKRSFKTITDEKLKELK